MADRDRTTRPEGTDLFSRLSRIIASRGEDTTPGPVSDGPAPDEPGHPEYHRRQRVMAALGNLDKATPPRYQGATATDPRVCAWADQVIADPRTAPSLMLWGDTGTGKTHQAYGAARRIALAGPARFGFIAVTFPDLYAALRPGGSPDLERERMMRRVMNVPLLLLDDLGTTKNSRWTEEITYRLINHRYNQQTPTMLTTNHPPGALPELLGDPIASRIIGITLRLQMEGNDRRKNP